MRCFWASASPISLKARVSSPTSSREVGGTRTSRSPSRRRSTPPRRRRSGPVSSATKIVPAPTPSESTIAAIQASWRVLLPTTGSTSAARSRSTCASPTRRPLKWMGALARTRLSASSGGRGASLPRCLTTFPSPSSSRTPTTPWPARASSISRSSARSSELPPVSRESFAPPARLAASASPRARTSATSARRSCFVATTASATQAVAITVTISALNLNWRERKPPPEGRGGRQAGLLGFEADAEDLELARSLRNVNRHARADLPAEQGARDRRGDRDATLRDVGFLLAEDRVGHPLAALRVLEVDGHAEAHLVGDLAGGVDHLGAREPVLELAHPPLEVALALLGGVELGVLRDVAVRARGLDLADDAWPLDALQVAELLLELLVARPRHRHAIHRRSPGAPLLRGGMLARPKTRRRRPRGAPANPRSVTTRRNGVNEYGHERNRVGGGGLGPRILAADRPRRARLLRGPARGRPAVGAARAAPARLGRRRGGAARCRSLGRRRIGRARRAPLRARLGRLDAPHPRRRPPRPRPRRSDRPAHGRRVPAPRPRERRRGGGLLPRRDAAAARAPRDERALRAGALRAAPGPPAVDRLLAPRGPRARRAL